MKKNYLPSKRNDQKESTAIRSGSKKNVMFRIALLTSAMVFTHLFAFSQKFEFSGNIQEYTVPFGVTTLKVKVWGAGGGGFKGGSGLGPEYKANGGSGGYSYAEISVTPCEKLYLYVGQGGAPGLGGRASGSGGGGSAILRGNTPLIVAGGGGGAAVQNTPGTISPSHGGAGGGTNGDNGIGWCGGNGGTQTSDGAAPSCSRRSGIAGLNGDGGEGFGGGSGSGSTAGYFIESSRPFGYGKGGRGFNYDGDQGHGGGGGGYRGGSSGGGDAGGFGGGGGSGFVPSGGTGLTGSGEVPPMMSDGAYVSGAALGGVAEKSGGNGLIVIEAGTPTRAAISGNSSFCAGSSVTLDAGSGYSGYLWSTSATTQTIQATQSGTYSVIVYNGSNCSDTAFKEIFIYEPVSCNISVTPENNIFTGGVATHIYLGYGPQSATLSAQASGGSGFSYQWNSSPYLSCTNCANPVFTPSAEGMYTFEVTVTNSNGCKSSCTVSFCVKDIRVEGKNGKGKVYLCHAPDGNPANRKTLSVSVNAVSAHLSEHEGDALGKCNSGCNSSKKLFSLTDETIYEEFDVEVYPSPFNVQTTLWIHGESDKERTINIYDLNGKMIHSQTIPGHQYEVSIGENLSSGVYQVVILQNSESKSIKVIKF